ncbi:MAG: energy-coupling factor ABC transporter permease [Nitrospirota bacterium]
MHMADALISPAVGGTMWVATAGLTVYSARKLKQEIDDRKVPLMGVLGAFVFAAQMINFTIPATGSSGHLGGGMILSILLGPHAAFLVMASILTVQALFFADGGLLALGCNIFNLGFFPCFVVYPFIYKKIVGESPTQSRIFAGAMASAVLGLQMGAFGVVLETLFSGITELPFGTFILLMQPIHLAIGIVEGLATALVVIFVWKARPEIVEMAGPSRAVAAGSLRRVLVGFLVLAMITGGALSWFASTRPDGLEWSMFRVSGKEELEAPEHGVHSSFAELQKKTAFLPDYDFKKEEARKESRKEPTQQPAESSAVEKWPAVSAGTSVAGIVGAGITMAVAGVIGFGLKRRQQNKSYPQ